MTTVAASLDGSVRLSGTWAGKHYGRGLRIHPNPGRVPIRRVITEVAHVFGTTPGMVTGADKRASPSRKVAAYVLADLGLASETIGETLGRAPSTIGIWRNAVRRDPDLLRVGEAVIARFTKAPQ